MKYPTNFAMRQEVRAIFEKDCNLCNEDYNTLLLMLEQLRVNASADPETAKKNYRAIQAVVYFLMMGDHLDGQQTEKLLCLADELLDGITVGRG